MDITKKKFSIKKIVVLFELKIFITRAQFKDWISSTEKYISMPHIFWHLSKISIWLGWTSCKQPTNPLEVFILAQGKTRANIAPQTPPTTPQLGPGEWSCVCKHGRLCKCASSKRLHLNIENYGNVMTSRSWVSINWKKIKS